MARNEEKANSLLNRWQALKSEMDYGEGQQCVPKAAGQGAQRQARPADLVRRRRPFLASECKSLPMAEKWRREMVREIGMMVRKIQNGARSLRLAPLCRSPPRPAAASLGEHVIRDMNDEINKKLRIKQHWEKQIMALGGPNYMTKIPSAAELDGKALPGRRGYKCVPTQLGPRGGEDRGPWPAVEAPWGHSEARRYFGAAKTLPGVRELFEEVRIPVSARVGVCC